MKATNFEAQKMIRVERRSRAESTKEARRETDEEERTATALPARRRTLMNRLTGMREYWMAKRESFHCGLGSYPCLQYATYC